MNGYALHLRGDEDPRPLIVTIVARLSKERHPVVLTDRMLAHLERVLGGMARAAAWLEDLASGYHVPILLVFQDDREGYAGIVPPRTWTQEKCAGYLAGMREELQKAARLMGNTMRGDQ